MLRQLLATDHPAEDILPVVAAEVEAAQVRTAAKSRLHIHVEQEGEKAR
jgi:hypothetical protein